MSSSFRKRVPASQAKLPPATRVNPHSAQLLVSTGVPALDDVLGGGLPVGGILLIEQDRQTGYSNTLLSYFASQGIAAGHNLCFVNAEQEEMDLHSQLPGWSASTTTSSSVAANKQTKTDSKDPNLKIAWRYQNMPKVGQDVEDTRGTAGEVQFCERFDLSTRIPKETLAAAKIDLIDGDKIVRMSRSDKYHGDMYKCVLDEIARIIESGGFSSLHQPSAGQDRNILRLELRSLGSEFWHGDSATSILQFLHSLRALLRYSYVACVISFPVHLYQDDESGRLPVVRRIEHLCDAVIELESFEGTYASPADIVKRNVNGAATGAATEYHGFLHIHKLPRLNSLTASAGKLSILHSGGGSANNLAFRQRRKKFCIETYHLPIEGGTTERRVPEDKKVRSAGCGSRPGKPDPLEF